MEEAGFENSGGDVLQITLHNLQQTEHGFKHIVKAGNILLADASLNHLQIAGELTDHFAYQGRMLATHMLGVLSATSSEALSLLKTKVAHDDNWRVQEMLAKAIDHYCKTVGYEQSLPEIRHWLDSPLPNLNRAVIEGLRVWTTRPYFKQHPEIAVQLIKRHQDSASAYVRKSVVNALRDIDKRHLDIDG